MSDRIRLKAAILDWAGTTVDFGSCAPAAVFLDVFFRRGLEITMEQAREPMGLPKKDHIRAISELPAVAAAWERIHGKRPTEADIDSMYAEFVPLQMACLRDYSELIPGVIEAIRALRERGMKIGSTTGYTEEMMAVLAEEARRQGYRPDCIVVPSQVPAGRPHPYMCWRVATELQVYPPAALVKVGDTIADIYEGLNAGMWTVAFAMTGNELGLGPEEAGRLTSEEWRTRRTAAHARLTRAGAHVVVDGIADLPAAVEEINQRLSRGEKP
ncbi:MAG: phosphonoacetaldehyde hydrolase [Blastocatellia bacterium]|nr:phosphonoacetaldehyde hydrolase [Blastocatellia bacterium]